MLIRVDKDDKKKEINVSSLEKYSGETEYKEPAFSEAGIPRDGTGEARNAIEDVKERIEKINAFKEKRIKKSLNNSVHEGAANSVMSGFGENNVGAFAVKLGANDMQIGFLSSFPLLIASFFQLFSINAIDKLKTRKRVILPSMVLQSIIWLGIAALALWFRSPILLIVLFTLEITFRTFMQSAWSSLLSDLTDAKTRGAFFGMRNKITGATNFISVLIAGRIIFSFSTNKNPEYLFYGFALIFFVSFVSRMISWAYLRRIYEKPYYVESKNKFSFWQFVKKMPTNNFGIFVLFICIFDFSIYISAPFFTPYMLNELGMNLWTYTLVNASTAIVTFLVMTYWGKKTDLFGNKKIFHITGYMIPLVPFLFILSKNPYYLFGVNAFSGFAWAGFNLSYTNFMYDAVTPQKRVRCMAYYNFLDGTSMFLGATAGALIVSALNSGMSIPIASNAIFLSKYRLIFIISAVLRLAVMIFFMPRIREVRLGLPDVSNDELFVKLIAVEPLRETAYLITKPVKFGFEKIGKLGKNFMGLIDHKDTAEEEKKGMKKDSEKPRKK